MRILTRPLPRLLFLRAVAETAFNNYRGTLVPLRCKPQRLKKYFLAGNQGRHRIGSEIRARLHFRGIGYDIMMVILIVVESSVLCEDEIRIEKGI